MPEQNNSPDLMIDLTDTKLPSEEYDSPWKEAITRYFPEFMAFYFPDASQAIDWSRGYTFLDQELAQVIRDAELGKRLLDKLVQVSTHDEQEQWVYIHIEIQSSRDSDFAKRLFTYNYRIFDRYDRPVASLAVLADESPGWKPKGYGYALFGSRMGLDFSVVKLLDYEERGEQLLTDPNPFALVTAAHLLTQQTRGDDLTRYRVKWRLAKLLYERQWDKQRIIDLFSVLDWMLRVPPELQQQLWQEIDQLERNRQMPYITSVERIGFERGTKIGEQIGEQRGEQRGEQKGKSKLLERLIIRRFGFQAMDETLRQKLATASTDQLEQWGENFVDAQTLEEVFR